MRIIVYLALLGAIAAAVTGLPPDSEGRHDHVSHQVYSELEHHGTARVLVSFHVVDNNKFSDLKLPERARRVEQVASRLIQRGGESARVLNVFRYARAMVFEVDAAALERLALHPAVRRIDHQIRTGIRSLPRSHDDARKPAPYPSPLESEPEPPASRVAILDTGIDSTSPLFPHRLLGEACFCTGEQAGCCPGGGAREIGFGSAADTGGHGTRVSSRVLASPEKSPADPGFVAVRVMDDSGGLCCPSDVIAGLDWLAWHHPGLDTVNLSLNQPLPDSLDCADPGNHPWLPAMQDAVEALTLNGTVSVATSGNDGSDGAMGAPACLPDVLSVGASHAEDHQGAFEYSGVCSEDSPERHHRACFSNHNEAVDLLAEGAGVSAIDRDAIIHIESLEGTSYASPQVAGCAAALREVVPSAGVDEIRQALKDSARPVSGEAPHLDCRSARERLKENLR